MNAIIMGLIGLSVGFVSGNYFNNERGADIEMGPRSMMNVVDETVVSDDFVSMRPQMMVLAKEEVSREERADLLFMREEEKLARDVYARLYEVWGVQIFSNIAHSEQTHTEAVRQLLDKYDIEDPVVDDTVGVFVHTDLQELYTTLVTQGERSLEEALIVGATIEELDIRDLEASITATDNQDIKVVYENLHRASRNHLRSFVKQLNHLGVDYQPQYISVEEYQAIVKREQERGRQNGWGGNGVRTGMKTGI